MNQVSKVRHQLKLLNLNRWRDNQALYVAREMFQMKYSMKNRVCRLISWIFVYI